MRGDLKPGDRLREAKIAEQMGVSRAPLREAIRDLASEGLVVSKTFKGAYVTQLSISDLWEIYTLRAVLERMAVEIVARKANPELLDTLRTSISAMVKAAEEGDKDRLVNLDLAFHETLVRNANHTRLLDIWNNMLRQIRVCMDLTHINYLAEDEMINMHTVLVKQIADKQVDSAGETLYRHILEVGERICQEYERP